MKLPEQVVREMLKNDEFSRWLGIEIIEIKEGYSKLSLKVRKDMLNGFNICHGGITYSLADSALAFAANSYGRICVSIENNISYLNSVKEDDVLTVIANEESKSANVSIYSIDIFNQINMKVAVFRGTVYRTKKKFFENEE